MYDGISKTETNNCWEFLYYFKVCERDKIFFDEKYNIEFPDLETALFIYKLLISTEHSINNKGYITFTKYLTPDKYERYEIIIENQKVIGYSSNGIILYQINYDSIIDAIADTFVLRHLDYEEYYEEYKKTKESINIDNKQYNIINRYKNKNNNRECLCLYDTANITGTTLFYDTENKVFGDKITTLLFDREEYKNLLEKFDKNYDRIVELIQSEIALEDKFLNSGLKLDDFNEKTKIVENLIKNKDFFSGLENYDYHGADKEPKIDISSKVNIMRNFIKTLLTKVDNKYGCEKIKKDLEDLLTYGDGHLYTLFRYYAIKNPIKYDDWFPVDRNMFNPLLIKRLEYLFIDKTLEINSCALTKFQWLKNRFKSISKSPNISKSKPKKRIKSRSKTKKRIKSRSKFKSKKRYLY